VKPCPFCEAELRDSVIRCTRCGKSLLQEPEPSAERQSARTAAASPILGAPTASAGSRGSRIGFPKDEPARPQPAVWATPAAPPVTRAATPNVAALRALPGEGRSSARPDFALLVSSLAAIGVAMLAWRAIGDPWVRLVITDTTDRLDPHLVGEITLRGQAALIGIIGQGFAAVLGVSGVMWFLYGFDRGSTMPWFVSPSISILTAIAGGVGVVVSAALWFVWKDAAIEHARAVQMTAQQLKALLDQQPEPLVEIERLSGLMRFGGAMVVGLLTSSTAWWAYRKRG
jgi:hypothetical protein